MSSLGDGVGRRRFLTLMGTAGATAVGLVVGWDQYTTAKGKVFLQLAQEVGGSHDIRALGREYLSGRPDEARLDLVLRRLAADLDRLPFGMTDGAVRRFCRRRIQDDFRDGHVVTVQGWVLSLTELRLCALASLLHDDV